MGGEQEEHGCALRGLSILVVDDEAPVRFLLDELLTDEGAVVTTADCVQDAVAKWGSKSFDLVVTDRMMPDGTGLELIEQLRRERDDLEAVLMSGHATLSSAVSAMQLGVSDYLLKPLEDLEDVIARIGRAASMVRLKQDNRRLIVELERKNAELSAMVVRDPLTGLFNHAYFHEALQSKMGGGDGPLALLFIGFDRFKKLNETYGHRAGDRVLREVAFMLTRRTQGSQGRSLLRPHDVSARYGSDIFTVILPETASAEALAIAQRLRASVTNLPTLADLPPVTLSIGVASFPEDARSHTALIEAADRALYTAKLGGRDRVETVMAVPATL